MNVVAAVAQVNPVGNPELQRGAPPAQSKLDTWCNKFVALVCGLVGVPMPWGQWGTLANDQLSYLREQVDGWVMVQNEEAAVNAAVAGATVIAGAHRLPHGHIAVGLPFQTVELQIAQAGAFNSERCGLRRGFGRVDDVEFFANFRSAPAVVVDGGSTNGGIASALGILLCVLVALGGVWVCRK